MTTATSPITNEAHAGKTRAEVERLRARLTHVDAEGVNRDEELAQLYTSRALGSRTEKINKRIVDLEANRAAAEAERTETESILRALTSRLAAWDGTERARTAERSFDEAAYLIGRGRELESAYADALRAAVSIGQELQAARDAFFRARTQALKAGGPDNDPDPSLAPRHPVGITPDFLADGDRHLRLWQGERIQVQDKMRDFLRAERRAPRPPTKSGSRVTSADLHPLPPPNSIPWGNAEHELFGRRLPDQPGFLGSISNRVPGRKRADTAARKPAAAGRPERS